MFSPLGERCLIGENGCLGAKGWLGAKIRVYSRKGVFGGGGNVKCPGGTPLVPGVLFQECD